MVLLGVIMSMSGVIIGRLMQLLGENIGALSI